MQLGREGERREGAIRRVGADGLETFVLADLRCLADRPALGADDVHALLKRLELRRADTHLVLDRGALVGADHPELALEDLRARLGAGERLVLEPGGKALRVALPRRMQLRGGRTWITAGAVTPAAPRPDPVLVDALRRAQALAVDDEPRKRTFYERNLRRLAFLSPELQRDIARGRQPVGLTLAKLMAEEPPLSWKGQLDWVATLAANEMGANLP